MRFFPTAILASAALAYAAPQSAMAKSYGVWGNEPTEAEMRAAIQRGLDGLAASYNNMAKGCAGTNSSGFEAARCLFGSLGVGASRGLEIAGFHKIGCVPAASGGFWCDYWIALKLPGAFDVVGDRMGQHNKRFRKTEDDRIALDR